jgi:hypothetical protein
MPRYLIRRKLIFADSPECALQEFIRVVQPSVPPGLQEVEALPDAPSDRVSFVCFVRDIPDEWKDYLSWLTATKDCQQIHIAFVVAEGIPENYSARLEEAEAHVAKLYAAQYPQIVTDQRNCKSGAPVFRYHEFLEWRERARSYSAWLSSSRLTYYSARVKVTALTEGEAKQIAMYKAMNDLVDGLYGGEDSETITNDNTKVDECEDLGPETAGADVGYSDATLSEPIEGVRGVQNLSADPVGDSTYTIRINE